MAPDPVPTSLSISGSTSFTAPGQTSQLSAIANYSNSNTQNVTATAVWQTSNGQVAVVSGGGLLTAQGGGTAEVTATVSGSDGPRQRQRGGHAVQCCPLRSTVTFERAGGTRTLGVQTSSSSCAWQASSNATWIRATGGASGTGNGTVTYEVEANGGSDQPTWLHITSGASGRGRGTVTYTVDRNGFATSRTGTISVGGPSGVFPRGRRTW